MPGFPRIVLAGLLLCAAGQAAPQQPSDAGLLRVGVTGDYAPYAWREEHSGELLGADVTLARGLAARLGLGIRFEPTTWSTLLPDALARRFDIAVGGISVTPERSRVVRFSRPHASDQKQPVVRCGEEPRFDTRAEIDQPTTRLVVNPGGTNERFVRATFPRASLVVHADNRSVFEEILAGRADVMVTDAVEGRLQQRQARGLCTVRVSGRWAPAQKAVMLQMAGEINRAVMRELAALGGARGYRPVLQRWEMFDWSRTDDSGARMARLIDARLALAVEVARSKWNSGSPIADPERERASLAALRAAGDAAGVGSTRVEAFFQAQMLAARQLQEDLFAYWKRTRRGPLPATLDLVAQIRPRIDVLNAQMLQELARQQEGPPLALPAASTMELVSARAVRSARAGILPGGT